LCDHIPCLVDRGLVLSSSEFPLLYFKAKSSLIIVNLFRPFRRLLVRFFLGRILELMYYCSQSYLYCFRESCLPFWKKLEPVAASSFEKSPSVALLMDFFEKTRLLILMLKDWVISSLLVILLAVLLYPLLSFLSMLFLWSLSFVSICYGVFLFRFFNKPFLWVLGFFTVFY
jgi:hypothetical protein